MLLVLLLGVAMLYGTQGSAQKVKPRILVSSDIGGTDPDDFQSMIHLLMYADQFQIEGLVSSPYGAGTKEDFTDIIALYEKDLPQLRKHTTDFPDADSLRALCKQGATSAASFKGFGKATEGSNWIIRSAQREVDQPLWILVWGGLEDVAQALHDAPDIKKRIKVYWIGGPNKKWSVNAYAYIAENHADLWMIEANATYRGWFLDSDSPKYLTNERFYEKYIQEKGAMGRAFRQYYGGILKMGDTPSLVYLLNGNPNKPAGESWGGSFTPIGRSSRRVFERHTTKTDTVAAYDVLEWHFKGPKLDIEQDSSCFIFEISGQKWPGYYLGEGIYGVRYASKRPEVCTYRTSSSIVELNGLTGQFVSITPWPGTSSPDDYCVGRHWYGDRKDRELFINEQQGAMTVAKHRRSFLMDWAKRWAWLKP
ncbi:nucleoside hydrolase-like domain-containing protein [Pareuzebyella sediminis]|uniref:nucleoside hydrolase-like domain-containing protein n=1 Tax=Pareuzebyella sediminis TaxID=2607998 RepID=UPI0011F07AAF|nr:nucleoside hydrolase-like domain-containing protein [Pareuzebyella sediminis]